MKLQYSRVWRRLRNGINCTSPQHVCIPVSDQYTTFQQPPPTQQPPTQHATQNRVGDPHSCIKAAPAQGRPNPALVSATVPPAPSGHERGGDALGSGGARSSAAHKVEHDGSDGILTEHGGDGGCSAHALARLEVYPSAQAAAAALDSTIAPLHEKFCKERGDCAESEAGVRGEQWHPEAVRMAVVDAGWHMKSLSIDKQTTASVQLSAQLLYGTYLLTGVTNNQWTRAPLPRKRLATKKARSASAGPQALKYPTYAADAPRHHPSAWLHTVPVINGSVHDHGLDSHVRDLWIGSDNKPDRDRGYFRSIRKVYRVWKCTAPGSGCKGGCR